MKRPTICATLLLTCLLSTDAFASGLGKFVAGTSEIRRSECKRPDPPAGALYRTRFAVMAGAMYAPEERELFGLYLDAGYRLVSTTGGCRSRSGMFGAKNWLWHSLILGVDTELLPAEPSSSPVGLMLAYDARAQSRGFLDFITNILPLGFGASVGVHYGGPVREGAGTDWGVGGSVFLRAIVDIRLGVDYNFGEVIGSFNVGLIDPHLLVAAIIKEVRD